MIHDHGPVRTIRWSFAARLLSCTGRPPGATLRGIAADLGISRHTLQDWVTSRGGTASTASTNGTTPARTNSGPAVTAPPRPGSPQAELAALRARIAALETENATLATERDILRQAAKYFAGETRW